MAIPGRFFGGYPGMPDYIDTLLRGGATGTYTMSGLNNAYSARFMALGTKDIKSVRVNWGTVTGAYTVNLRVETDTSGKPSGTLYDANATKSFTPTVGWQNVVFDTLPTTGLVAGTIYHLFFIVTSAGTTLILRSHVGSSGTYPMVVLTAADGTTRTNLAEQFQQTPVAVIVYEDDTEEAVALVPAITRNSFLVYGTRAAGSKFVLNAGEALAVAGIHVSCMGRAGTPAGDPRARIFLESSAVSGASSIVPRAALLNVNGTDMWFPFNAPVILNQAGTYSLMIDQQGVGDSSNYWQIFAAACVNALVVPDGMVGRTTTDITTGNWADSATDTASDWSSVSLLLDELAAGSGGAVPQLVRATRKRTVYSYR